MCLYTQKCKHAHFGYAVRMAADDRDEILDSVGAAFSRLRRRTSQSVTDHGMSRRDLTRNLIINLVDEADGGITVGAVADQLNVDPSVASRMVADCIESGYLERTASQSDGRRTVLNLTAAGIELRDVFRRLQRQSFEQITAGWAPSDQLAFARLLIRYADDSSLAG